MGGVGRRRWSVFVALSAVVVLGATSMAVAAGTRSTALHFRRSGLSARRVLRRSAPLSGRVIVVLRNQIRSQAANKAHIARRARAVAAAQRPLIAQVARSGGHVNRRFRTVNAFAATVSSAEGSRLAANPAVARVVPDRVITLPQQDRSPIGSAGPAAATPTPQSGICPSDPAHPLQEPEALQTTHSDQAQAIADGHGVKVAFFADGLDIDNPDFIRADGSHVFVDYRDFSGGGPNEPTNSLEAFGDASSIAAQGRIAYDLSQFVNPAHPLPPGCDINVRGMAPGASLIGMKVFSAESAYTSNILQGLDWAVSVDHADILSESFGSAPIPDTSQDLVKQFNDQAVAAGIDVVVSSGDAGLQAGPESAGTDPAVIDAGANTNMRLYAQTTSYAFQFSNGTWLSDNMSAISSGGVSQNGLTVDLVAPGESGWALCTPNPAVYQGCVDNKGAPARLEQFGGTSESAPLIAGGAADVIQAYRDTHGGSTPSPALVKQILTSTAQDLGFPSSEQGAGEMNTLRAVQAARSVDGGTPTGNGVLVGPGQLTIDAPAGSFVTRTVTVTNAGAATQTLSARARAISQRLATVNGTVNLGTAPTFTDQFGAPRPYRTVTFNVPAGADRLAAFYSWPGPRARVGLTLIDPHGTYAAYSRPQGNGDHTEVDLRDPVAGRWTAIIFLRDGTFTGPVHFQFRAQKFFTVDSVTPHSLTLAPGQSGHFSVRVPVPSSPVENVDDLVITGAGGSSVVPIVKRGLVALGRNGGTFSGTIVGGNGRGGEPGQEDTILFDVPPGRQALSVSLSFPDDPNTELQGTLVDPAGQARSFTSTVHIDPNTGAASFTNALQAYRLHPQAGRWQFVVDVVQPVGGDAVFAPYSGRVDFRTPPVTVTGLPSGRVPAGVPITARVRIRNNGATTNDFFVDPRLRRRADQGLLPLTPTANVPLPTPPQDIPEWLVPTQTRALFIAAQATEPITFDWGYGFGDPQLGAIRSGNVAFSAFRAPEVSQGLWFMAPAPVGPFAGPATPGTFNTGMVARTREFDTAADSTTGDIWRQTVDPGAPAYTPVVLDPGQRGTIDVTFTPTGSRGDVVRGILYVDDFSFETAFGDEIVAIPYRYRIR